MVRSPAASRIGAQHFPETGHSVGGAFLTFWQQHGGLATFGYPITEAFEEDGRTVQYFERQRFELHPEHAAPYNVLLGLLGVEALSGGAHPAGPARGWWQLRVPRGDRSQRLRPLP